MRSGLLVVLAKCCAAAIHTIEKVAYNKDDIQIQIHEVFTEWLALKDEVDKKFHPWPSYIFLIKFQKK